MAEPILQIRDLTVEFSTEDGIVRAVTGVSYDLMPGEVLGVVGESGSGKSVSMLTVLGLTPMPPGRIASGEAIYKGTDLLKMPKKQLRDLRGGEGEVSSSSMNSIRSLPQNISSSTKKVGTPNTPRSRPRSVSTMSSSRISSLSTSFSNLI